MNAMSVAYDGCQAALAFSIWRDLNWIHMGSDSIPATIAQYSKISLEIFIRALLYTCEAIRRRKKMHLSGWIRSSKKGQLLLPERGPDS